MTEEPNEPVGPATEPQTPMPGEPPPATPAEPAWTPPSAPPPSQPESPASPPWTPPSSAPSEWTPTPAQPPAAAWPPPAPSQQPPASWPPSASPPPPQQTPPVYQWSQPAEPAGPAPGIRFAGYGARIVAYIVDGFIVAITTIIVAIGLAILIAIFANAGSNAAAGLTGLGLAIAILAITIGYFPYFWSHGGQTPGMRMLRIRVVRDRDGGPVSPGQAVLRLIGYWLSGAVFYLGYIWVFIDNRRRGWHDLIAGTVVIEA